MAEKTEAEPKKVEGYIVLSDEGKFLAKDLFWFPHEKPEEAMVFSNEVFDTIRNTSDRDNWETKPKYVIPATWSQNGGVVVTGEKIKISELPPLQEK